MARKFNTAGPCIEGDHYMLDPLARIEVEEVLELIDAKRYFVLYGPPRSGKTTCLRALTTYLNAGERCCAFHAHIDRSSVVLGDLDTGIAAVAHAIAEAARRCSNDEFPSRWLALHGLGQPSTALGLMLSDWAVRSPKPIVLLIDDVDALAGVALLSFLRQIRAGFIDRPLRFPQSVVLCGVHDLRDSRIKAPGLEVIPGGSPTNFISASMKVADLHLGECQALFAWHVQRTGGAVADEVWPELWEDTRGQPWLVNALAYECTWEDRSARDRAVPITLERYRAARERLIQSRSTHLEQLGDKLREPRVHRVIAGLLEGEGVLGQLSTDDLEYVQDLGLVRTRPQLEISNRIYREVIPRELTWTAQARITPAQPQPWYVRPDRRLDVPKLLAAFQQFFCEHSDAWIEGFSYKEAGPQLLMQAFLQRIVNGGGRISREYGLGRKRTDLLLEWPLDEAQGFNGPVQRVVIELKLLKKAPEATLQQGLEQTADYAAQVGADEAHLVLFDRRPGVGWDERIWQRAAAQAGREIGVWGA
jgi:hypothetical protein